MLTHLDDRPVLGVSMGNVSLLRLDRQNHLAPGNKYYKLQGNLTGLAGSLAPARLQADPEIGRLVSFGGPWSNHLHALAAVGHEKGLETVGIVRGEAGPGDTATLADAARWGMQLVNVSRSEYRQRNDPAYLEEVARRFGPCRVIPEGGSNAAGARGCVAIGELLKAAVSPPARILLAVGTGTTLAGTAAGLGKSYEVIGVSALKGAADLEQRVGAALAWTGRQPANWSISHNDHCGGFARVSEELREFILAFESVHGIELDPIYTGKVLFAIFHRLRRGQWDRARPIVAVHTGGLQGRRGFPFLLNQVKGAK